MKMDQYYLKVRNCNLNDSIIFDKNDIDLVNEDIR